MAMPAEFRLTNPKLRRESREGRAQWYPYYAGYSPAFVADMLGRMKLQAGSQVLDPWNGSGTTTTVCSQSGVASIGYDINPAMVVVAKARLLPANTALSLEPLLRTILQQARCANREEDAEDPLCAWFGQGTSSKIRSVQRSICEILVAEKKCQPEVNELSSLAAFFYVLLFRMVRGAIKGAVTTNPTWIKAQTKSVARVGLTWNEISAGLVQELQHIRLLEDADQNWPAYAPAEVCVGNSTSIDRTDSSVDGVITSPPYCTRIDYAVATRVELAVMNMGSNGDFEKLRREMLGTTLKAKIAPEFSCDGYAGSLLKKIREHPSKASSSYYYSTFSDYFLKLQGSLGEIGRILKPGGSAVIVVQDSMYKELHVDLARFVCESMIKNGLILQDRWDFPVLRSMHQIRANSDIRKESWRPTESVLLLRK